MTVKLSYFDVTGLGERIRLACILNGVDFEDNRVQREDWVKMKDSTKYGQMPLLELEDGTTIAQSDAILRYVGSLGSGKLYPQDPRAQAKVNEALGVSTDLFHSVMPKFRIAMEPTKYGHSEDFAETEEGKAKLQAVKENWVAEELPKFAKFFTNLLKENGGEYLASTDYPTIADCSAVSFLNEFGKGFVQFVPADWIEEYPELKAYIDRFMALPEVAEWYSK